MTSQAKRSIAAAVLAAIMAVLLNALNIAPVMADVYYPTQNIELRAGLVDTLGNRYTDTAPDSVVAAIWINGDYWKREHLEVVSDGASGGWVYSKIIRCDSAYTNGDYYAEVTAHTLHSGGTGLEVRTPFDFQTWRVEDWPIVLFAGRGQVAAGSPTKFDFPVTFANARRDSSIAGHYIYIRTGDNFSLMRRIADYDSTGPTTGTITLADSLPSAPAADDRFFVWREPPVAPEVLALRGVVDVTVTAIHSGTTPVGGALIAIRDEAGTNVLAWGLTDTNGEYHFWRPRPNPDETVKVYLSHATTAWTVPQTLVITPGDQSVTYDGTDHTPTVAPDPTLKHIFGYWKAPGGDAGALLVGDDLEGVEVWFELIRGRAPYVTATSLSKYRFRDLTDENGRWDLWVTPNSDITPSGTRYRVTIKDPEGDVRRIVTVPDTPGATQFKDL
jgi:hypothetical protein